jgi:ABC-2 type transport system ATP-binding protein
MTTEAAVSTIELTKSYRSVAALQNCTVEIPPGRICALIGPNGAGKTTLLKLLAGLSRPSAGAAAVLGRRPGQDPQFLAEVGFLAQEIPLWRRFSARDHLAFGAHLNPRWDQDGALERLRTARVDLDRPVATLSGGQRAQVALTLALGKRPRLLLLDEPVAALDPLARRHFLAALVAAVADGDLTVLISSHLIGDLERICDYLVLLAAGRTQLCGDIAELVSEHKLLTGTRESHLAGVGSVIETTHTGRQTTVLARHPQGVLDPSWEVSDVDLEEIVLAYMGQQASVPAPALPPTPTLRAVGGDR